MASVTEITMWQCDHCGETYDDEDDAVECHPDEDCSEHVLAVNCPVCMRSHDTHRQIKCIELFNKCESCSPILTYEEKELLDGL